MKKSWLKDCNSFEYPYHANWWRNIFTKISLTKPQNQLLVIMIGCNDKRKWWQREGCYDKVILCARRESSPIHFLNTSFSPSLPIFPLQDGTFLQRSCDKPFTVFTFLQGWWDKDFVSNLWSMSGGSDKYVSSRLQAARGRRLFATNGGKWKARNKVSWQLADLANDLGNSSRSELRFCFKYKYNNSYVQIRNLVSPYRNSSLKMGSGKNAKRKKVLFLRKTGRRITADLIVALSVLSSCFLSKINLVY